MRLLRYTQAFSMLEMLICIAIISIISVIIIKPYTTEEIALRQARLHIQTAQHQINQATYYAFLQKQPLQSHSLQIILNNNSISTKLFSFKLQRDQYILQIGKKRLVMPIKKTNINHYVITCNPSQTLCRKLYHRKHSK